MEDIPLDDDDDNVHNSNKNNSNNNDHIHENGNGETKATTATTTTATTPAQQTAEQPRWRSWRICFNVPVDETALALQRQAYNDLLVRHADAVSLLVSKEEADKNDESSLSNHDDNNYLEEPPVDNAEQLLLSPSRSNMDPDLDPLTAMVQELDQATLRDQEIERQYHHRRTMGGKSGGHRNHRATATAANVVDETPDEAAAYRELITKDLHRLAPIIVTSSTGKTVRDEHADRLVILGRLLLLYSLEHKGGYLQGMHEIASFVLHFVSESMEITDDVDHGDQDDTATASTTTADHAEADAYLLTCHILQSLTAAYDLEPTVSVLYQSKRILHLLSNLSPPELYNTLHRHDTAHMIPFQLIFTKWIRLLFGREIGGPDMTNNIGMVWDGLFAVGNLQKAAEALAAARLWHYGHQIISLGHHHQGGHHHGDGEEDLMHYCMNMPVIDDPRDIQIWLRRMRVLLQLEPNTPDLQLPPFVVPSPPQHVPFSFQPQSLHQQLLHPQQQPMQTTTMSTSLWDNPTVSTTTAVAAQLTSFTEKLAAQTQHLSKQFLSLENWTTAGTGTTTTEHHPLGGHHHHRPSPQSQQQQHAHHHPLASAAVPLPPPPLPTYNLNYHADRPAPTGFTTSTATSISPTTTRTTTSLAAATPAPVDVADRLRRDTTVLQQFAISVEQTAGVRVPPQVWSALADLEALQQHLSQHRQ
jgi:hypothetical protein